MNDQAKPPAEPRTVRFIVAVTRPVADPKVEAAVIRNAERFAGKHNATVHVHRQTEDGNLSVVKLINEPSMKPWWDFIAELLAKKILEDLDHPTLRFKVQGTKPRKRGSEAPIAEVRVPLKVKKPSAPSES